MVQKWLNIFIDYSKITFDPLSMDQLREPGILTPGRKIAYLSLLQRQVGKSIQ